MFSVAVRAFTTVKVCRIHRIVGYADHEKWWMATAMKSLWCDNFSYALFTVFCQIRCYVNHFVTNPRVSTVPAGNHQGSIGGVNVVTMGSTCLETRTSIEEGGAHSATLDDTGVPSCYPAQILTWLPLGDPTAMSYCIIGILRHCNTKTLSYLYLPQPLRQCLTPRLLNSTSNY